MVAIPSHAAGLLAEIQIREPPGTEHRQAGTLFDRRDGVEVELGRGAPVEVGRKSNVPRRLTSRAGIDSGPEPDLE